jgi:protein required for attachment to host cells
MPTVFVVAANASRARIFAQRNFSDPLEEVADLVNPAARERETDIVTDNGDQRAAGKSRHGTGQPTTGSDYQPHQTPQQHEAEKFARDVADYLERAHNEGRFAEVCLVASPEFLGLLRRQVGPRLGDFVTAEINKDYTADNADRLRERIREHTRPH